MGSESNFHLINHLLNEVNCQKISDIYFLNWFNIILEAARYGEKKTGNVIVGTLGIFVC